MNPDFAPCIAVVGPANAGKSTLLQQLDERLQQRLGAVLVIKGNPDGSGLYLFRAPSLREELKQHVKGKWGHNTVRHICESIQNGRRNLQLALLDFGGKRNADNDVMLGCCSHYIVVSRFGDIAGANEWDADCRRNALTGIAWLHSIGPQDVVTPGIQPSEDHGWEGTFRHDVQPGEAVNDHVIERLVDEMVALRREPDLVPYVDLHEDARWEESHTSDVRGRAAKIGEMARRTGVVLLGGAAPIWAYLAGLRCALETNPDTRIFFFDPQQPERLVEIPGERRDGIYPPDVLDLQWTLHDDYAQLELHLTASDRFLPPIAAQNLAFAPGFGEIPHPHVCLWGKAPTWLYATYARWLIRAGVQNLSSFDAGMKKPIQVWSHPLSS